MVSSFPTGNLNQIFSEKLIFCFVITLKSLNWEIFAHLNIEHTPLINPHKNVLSRCTFLNFIK